MCKFIKETHGKDMPDQIEETLVTETPLIELGNIPTGSGDKLQKNMRWILPLFFIFKIKILTIIKLNYIIYLLKDKYFEVKK